MIDLIRYQLITFSFLVRYNFRMNMKFFHGAVMFFIIICSPILVYSSKNSHDKQQTEDVIYYLKPEEGKIDNPSSVKFVDPDNWPNYEPNLIKSHYKQNNYNDKVIWEQPLEISEVEKKQDHSERLCLNIPMKKKIVSQIYEQNQGYFYKPNTLIEHKCEPVPPEISNDLYRLQHDVLLCKVRGPCVNRSREITIFRKEVGDDENSSGQCWEKEHYNVTLGCHCLSHFHPA